MERVLDRRKRTVEEELAQSQQQAQLGRLPLLLQHLLPYIALLAVVALRNVRQSNQQNEQKKADLENLMIELRTVERKCEEVRRSAREQGFRSFPFSSIRFDLTFCYHYRNIA